MLKLILCRYLSVPSTTDPILTCFIILNFKITNQFHCLRMLITFVLANLSRNTHYSPQNKRWGSLQNNNNKYILLTLTTISSTPGNQCCQPSPISYVFVIVCIQDTPRIILCSFCTLFTKR